MAVTPRQQDAINLYYVMMAEARFRLDFLHSVVHGHRPAPHFMIGEICYLQLRMLCESIALASLVAHGDLTQPRIKKFEQEYAADKILKMMEEADQDSFPQQVELLPNEIKANTKPNALKRDELLRLYRRCGERLHRGKVKAVTKIDLAKHGQFDQADIVRWTQKAEDLLGAHVVPLFAQEKKAAMLVCVLRDSARNLDTSVNRLELEHFNPPPHNGEAPKPG